MVEPGFKSRFFHCPSKYSNHSFTEVGSSGILVLKKSYFSFYIVLRQSFQFIYSFSFSEHFYFSFYTIQMQSFLFYLVHRTF